jgi:chitinase
LKNIQTLFIQVDCKQGPKSDKDGFSALVKELSAALKPKGLLLSAAVSPSFKVIDEGYDVPVLNEYLDHINVMTYDYYGHWDKQTGHVAPLYHHPDAATLEFNAVSAKISRVNFANILLVPFL